MSEDAAARLCGRGDRDGRGGITGAVCVDIVVVPKGIGKKKCCWIS